jgi:hypothetical protein
VPADVVRIEVGVEVSGNYHSRRTGIIQVPREQWEALDEAARKARMDAELETFMAGTVSGWARVLGDDEDTPGIRIGLCADCRQHIRLSRSGRLPSHKAGRTQCSGSGSLPVSSWIKEN